MPTPKRLLLVSHVAELGGAERSLLDLVEELDQDEFSTVCVMPRAGELATRLERAGARVRFCAGLGRLERGGWSELSRSIRLVRTATAIARIATQERADLVHANSTSAALQSCAAPGVLGRPLLWHVRDFRLGAERHLLRWRASAVIVPSKALRRHVLARGVRRVVRIPNGIDLRPFQRQPAAPTRICVGSAHAMAVVISHFAPWKGLSLVVRVVEALQQADVRLSLRILGGAPFDRDHRQKQALEHEIRSRGLVRQIELVGMHDTVADELSQADLLIHPAFPEPFGRVVVEAMAAGCPVVAFGGTHGPSELLERGGGELVQPRTVEAMAQAIARLIQNPERRYEIGRAGRKTASRYSRKHMARRMARVYRLVLSKVPG